MTLRIGLLCFCLLTLTAKAQYNPFHVPKNLPDRDSLKAIIQTTNNPIQKLDALRELGHAYYENKRDSALFFFEQSVATAKQINSRLWEADAFNSLGFVSYILGNYPRALQFLNQAKTIAEDAGSEKGEWRSNPSGFVAPHVARLSILARSYQHLATLYSYTRSSADTGSSDLSLGLYRKALAISTSIEDTTMMGIINMNTSRFFSLENELDSVVFYHKRALQLMNAAGYTRYIGNVMYIMGEAYRKHQQPETAKIFYWYGMEQGKNIENTRSAADNSLALANLLLAQGNTDSAIFYGYSAAELYKSTLILSGLADSYATLSSAFNAKNKIDSAFHYQGLSLSARKQLDAEDNSRRFQQLAFDEKLKAQEAAERERLARNRIIMIILLSGLAILAAIGIFLYRNNIARKKANQLLAGKNRELEIEASLDRVRTRALAMHSSGELLEVANVLRDQMGLLNQPELETSAILIFHDDLKSWDSWHAFRPTRDGRGKVRTGTATFSRDACAFTREIFDHYLLPQTEYTLQVSGAKREEWITVLMNAAPEIAENAVNDEIANFPTTYFHFSDFTGGSLLTVSYQPPSNEIKSLQQRAAKVFDLAFRRFLDLKKAESQAREAQIEAALEKVRSRSMAMHKSEELKEVIQLVYDQMLHLKMPVEHTGFIIDYKQRDDMHIWLADMNSTPVEVSFPYFDAPHWNSYIEAKKTGASFFANHHSFEEKNAFYTKLFDLLPGVLDDVRDFYFKCPGLDVSTVLLDNIGLYIENFSGNPYTDEENAILMRFGKVFQQAYTRFIDLQKAEASAREAQIEAALERIRSRSMAMHKSEELADLSMEVVKQIQALGVPTWFCAFNIHDDDPRGSLEWGSNAEATFPKYRTPREGIFLRYYEAWQRGEKLLVNEIGEDECSAHYEYLCSLPGVGEQLLKMKNAGIPFPTYQIDHVAYFKYGYILFITYQPVPETHEIFKRFAKVFEQSYTRFLDLQKAEAQAREAQIEAALERVRSRSLAMHHTNELQDVVNVAAQQLLRMDIDFDGGMFITVNDEVKDDLPFWAAAGAADYVQKVTLPFLDRPTFTVLHNAILRREPFHTEYYSASEKNEFLEHMFRYDPWKQNSEERKQELLARQGGYTRSVVIGKYTSIGITNHHGKIFSDAENDVLRRFGAVLEQSYTRFLDLQKAEEQAREAQIQLALERARSQSMTMQRSVELDDTLRVFHEQVLHLGISSEFSFLWLPDEEKDRHIFWATWAEKKLNVFNSKAINYPLDRTEPATALCLADWKGSEPVVSYRVTAEGVTDYFAAWSELIAGVEELKPENFKEGLYYVEAFIRYGCFGVMVRNELKEDEKEILRRFAVEFESTYTRFLDLRKAEAQAREARIEAALEKVRSRTMAMQKSSELPDAANVLFLQVQSLGIPAWSCGYNILAPDKRSCTCIMSSEGEIQIPFVLPLTEHWSFLPWYEAIQTGFEFFTNEQGGEDLVEHYRYMGTVPGLEDVFKQFDDAGISLPTHQINHLVSFTNGFLLFITYEPVPEAHDIFKRFAKVFEQTYTRFLDLQKAEEQTREAQIEAALEKVRSRTLAMQRSDELGEVASILFKQMNQIVHNLWTCGFVLCEKDRTEDEWWLSMDGDFTRGFFLPNVDDYAHATLYEGWLKGETARSVQLDGEALQQHYDWLMEIPVARKIFEEMDAAGLARPDWQKLHAAYFSKGYLVLITREPCAEEEIFKRFAAVFNLAYTRFKDLQISEAHALQAEKDLIAIKEAKQKAEVALTELQATQKQLIQAEKMASLGELTAGIAHEIQNPLNFVNNFSSLNTELVAELKEAISSGNWADAEEIIGMLSENEEKILQHGKRADAIVKGMLQHTRSGSGTKEPTDINALCDEYLRLAFHGFRAKDKSFNSDFNFTADPDLGKINAVPQEIGRVILNLISNAFYAVHEKAKSSGKDYQPAVKVMTRKSDGMVVIAVADNGTGIPQKVVDKIFQPFFTTKPTGEGTGLGLSLSYDIVKAHGGELKVETKEGEGTAFVISLPANSV